MGLVQHAQGSATSGSTVAATFGSNTTGGTSIPVMVSNQTARTVSSIALGGSSDTFTKAVAAAEGTGGEGAEIWIDASDSSGHTVVTATFSSTVTGAEIDITEWSGISSGTADKTNTGTGFGVSSWSSNSTGALGQSLEVAFGVTAVNSEGGGSVTLTGPASPWTNFAQINAAAGISQLAGYQQVNGPGALTYSGTSSIAVAEATAIATFKLTVAPAPSPFAQPTVAPRGQVARRGRVLGPGQFSRGAPFKPHKILLISLASAAGIDDYSNSFPEGILATAGIIEGPTIIGSSAFYYNGTPAFGNLISSITQAAGTDQFGNAYVAGTSSYFIGSTFAAVSVTGGSVTWYTAPGAAGPWGFIGQLIIPLTGASTLILDFASLSGAINVPQAAVSGFPLPNDANSGSTWVSGERAFMNNSWITPINNLYSALVAAGIV